MSAVIIIFFISLQYYFSHFLYRENTVSAFPVFILLIHISRSVKSVSLHETCLKVCLCYEKETFNR